MHPALSFQFERAVREYARWCDVPPDDRSAAPAWWWGPAIALRDVPEPLPAPWGALMNLPSGADCRAAAALMLDALQPQTTPTWPDEFPHKYKPPEPQA